MESNEIIHKMKTKGNCCTHPIWALLHLIEANVIREKKHRHTYRKKYTSLALKFIFGSNSHCFLFHFSMKTKRSNWNRKKTIIYNGSVCGGDANGTEEKKSAYRRKRRDILSLHRIQPACNYVLSLSLFMFPVETEVATVISEKMLAKEKKTLTTHRNMRATKQR